MRTEAASGTARTGRQPLTIIGAPSSIGIRPYDTGEARALDQAPGVLRELGLVERLDADDEGDVVPPEYVDFTRAPGRARNEAGMVAYSRELGERVKQAVAHDRFTLVLGGDCSIVLGCLLGAGARAQPIGLAYVDGHADFATPQESTTGSVASMCLALAVGRGDSPLAHLTDGRPLVQADDVVLIGRRDGNEPAPLYAALGASGILDLPDEALTEQGGAETAAAALARLARPGVSGFWIHVDADVLDPAIMPAVDSPEPGGPDMEALTALVAPLARHPRALGMHLTIYDPALDPDRACARRLATFLESVLAPNTGADS